MARFLPLAILPLSGMAAAAVPLSGVGRSIDGDSLMVGQTEVRLYGIDAPEFTQTCTRGGQAWLCGSAAADQLSKLVSGKQISCQPRGTDRFGRIVARCTVGNTDLNRTMVASGYALAFRRYSMDYISAEESAKASKRGIWSGTFELPSDVRHGDDDHGAATPPQTQQTRGEMPVVIDPRSKRKHSGGCTIKGNHSSKGEKIYHLPGKPYYDETVAEQFFCTEAAAQAAGYRRSRADQHR